LILITACKRHNPAAGATQGYERLNAKPLWESLRKRHRSAEAKGLTTQSDR
jgi:hypothetical protein